MQARRDHERALAEDPTIFDYDNVYDELQAKKNQKIAEIKAADKERKVHLVFSHAEHITFRLRNTVLFKITLHSV